ncbi:MAG TPA: sigma factor [Candidatus Acidoferrales bacterium]|nr:sigma factor [Candidatus Acidoferrales bacterium]
MASRGERFLIDSSTALTGSAGVSKGAAVEATTPLLDRLKLRLNSDEELTAKLREGQNEALTVLFERYSAPVFRHARRVLRNDAEAEDVVQQVSWTCSIRRISLMTEKAPSAWFRSWLQD